VTKTASLSATAQRMLFACTGIATAALLLLVPAVSSAQTSSVEGYGGNGGEVQAAIADPTTAPQDGEIASLPFTGFDVGYMLAGAGLLLLAGLAMGRFARRSPEAH
jgi:hypothetical protein